MNQEPIIHSLEEMLQAPLPVVHQNFSDTINPALFQRMQGINYCPTFDRGLGAQLWDQDGNVYVDCHSGYGALNLGHNHPAVIAAVRWALDKQVVNLAQASVSRWIGFLGVELSRLTNGHFVHSFFSNSGAEAVEGALKMARKATGRTKFVCTTNGFHGKTYGALSVTGQPKYQQAFQPLVGDVWPVPFDNVDALWVALQSKDVAGFIVEPIQGEGGVIIPSDSYLSEVERICRETGTLLILDEIQTGFGRTGDMFRFQRLGIRPDILCLAKALGGGLAAIGATMATDEVWHAAYGKREDSTLHTSTFGGGSIACIAGLATIKVVVDDNLPERARTNGTWLLKELRTLQQTYPSLIQEVRGEEGLMIGVEFNKQKKTLGSAIFAAATRTLEKVDEGEAIAGLVARELLKRGVVTAFTLNRENVIRIAPPLIASQEDLTTLLRALEDVLSNFDSLWKLNGGLKGAIQSLTKPGG